MKPQSAKANRNDDRDRWLRARVELLIGSRPVTMFLNPLWAVLVAIPLGGSYPAFGIVPMSVLAAMVVLHLFNVGLAFLVYRRWQRNVDSPQQILALLTAFQMVASASWATGACMYWVEGNAANNTFCALLVVGMMWAHALSRSAHPLVFLAGLLPLTAIFWVRALLGTSEAAEVFVVFTPVFAAYAAYLGTTSRQRIEQVIRSRFENEDLARNLDAARRLAVTKSAEAEAASASKSAFVANMSHELRTPLNAILGFSEIIANESLGSQANDKYREYARDIHDSGAHLLNLINDMLDIAKIEAGRVDIDCTLLDARQTIDAGLLLAAQKAQAKRQTIEVAVEPSVRLNADERAFKQILVNLVSNAVKFTPEGGRIGVELRTDANGASRLTIEDSGPGIPPDMIGHLFKPFSQADNRYNRSAGGTGLGLSLVRGLVALHGGNVWLENKAGGGLLVCVVFPSASSRIDAA
jgi:two-component system, cell cycle sensor histidine kinase PleC